MGDSYNGSGVWGLFLSSCCVKFAWTTAIVANIINGFGGRLRSFRLGETKGCCAPKPYGNVEALKSSSRVTISVLGDVTEERVKISLVCIPDSSIEFKKVGELFRCRLGLIDSCSTKNASESIELIEILEAIFKCLQN